MKILKSRHFLAGVLAGYLLLLFFPQLNVRAHLGKPGRA